MNILTIANDFPDDLLSRLEKLADGELAGAERAAVLERVQAHPEGWRLCALALLEAQALRSTAASLAREVMPAPKPAPARPTGRESKLRLVTWTARAAMVALAFAAGALSATRFATQNKPEPAENSASGRLAFAQNTAKPKPASPAQTRKGFVHLVSSVSLADRFADLLKPGEGGAVEKGVAFNHDAYIPEDIQAFYQNQGYEVKRDRRVFSLVLDDGSTAVLPLDQLSLNYVGQTIH